ncbi:helix-turn-helix domain-containing protein [Nocardia sp. NPDC127526]|uniref:helix-turn-helix domain-containing protein n=1 Tax=Nocardia sp. NPDC127526 TaxID=3345393 RepID=UPI00363AC60F
MNYGRIRRGDMSADNYTAVANAIFRSAELSGNAVKIFGLLASHKNGYGVTVDQIAKHMKCKVDAVRTALKELETFGLLVRTRERRPDGTLGSDTEYFITDQEFLAREREREQNRRSEPKRENPVLAVTSGNAENSEELGTVAEELRSSDSKPAGRNQDGKNPIQADPGTKKNKNYKKTNTPSVRPERNAGATAETAADGRTDGDPAAIQKTHTEPIPAQAPAQTAPETALAPGTAAALLAEPEVTAHLARIDMRPEQRRRLETAVDAALLRFSADRTARYLREKACDAETAMYLVRAFELYADSIALVGAPSPTPERHPTPPAENVPVSAPSAAVDATGPFNRPTVTAWPETAAVIEFGGDSAQPPATPLPESSPGRQTFRAYRAAYQPSGKFAATKPKRPKPAVDLVKG